MKYVVVDVRVAQARGGEFQWCDIDQSDGVAKRSKWFRVQPHEQRRFYGSEVDAQLGETDEFLAAKEEAEYEDNTYSKQEVRLRTFSLSF